MAFYTACVLALLGAAMWMMRCAEQNFNSTGFFDHCPMASSLTMMFRLEEHRPITRVVVFYTLQQNLRGVLNFRPQASRSNSPPRSGLGGDVWVPSLWRCAGDVLQPWWCPSWRFFCSWCRCGRSSVGWGGNHWRKTSTSPMPRKWKMAACKVPGQMEQTMSKK